MFIRWCARTPTASQALCFCVFLLSLRLLNADEDGDGVREHQRRRQASRPKGDFNDILEKASRLKAAQTKDKRRTWEASPEFMKNTMVSGYQNEVSNFRLYTQDYCNLLHLEHGLTLELLAIHRATTRTKTILRVSRVTFV